MGDLIRLKQATKVLPISYSSLYRLATEKDGPFLPAFIVLGDTFFVDVERFLEIGKEEAVKKAKET